VPLRSGNTSAAIIISRVPGFQLENCWPAARQGFLFFLFFSSDASFLSPVRCAWAFSGFLFFFFKKRLGLSEWSISDMNRYFFWATKSDFVLYFFDLTSPSIDPSVG
jgi:hypothetical protein